MPKFLRITRSDFRLMRGFSRVPGRHFTLAWGSLPGKTTPLATCVVSSKVAASAVDRNRVRRRARAILAEILKTSGKRQVYVLYAKKSARGATFKEIEEDIRALMGRSSG